MSGTPPRFQCAYPLTLKSSTADRQVFQPPSGAIPPSAPETVSPPPAPRRVAFAGGGTAGHVFPLLAIASAYRAARPEAVMLFIGADGDPLVSLADGAGLNVATVPAAPLFGVGPLGWLRAAGAFLRGQRAARRLLRAECVELVIGSGGYASAAPLCAARRLGLVTAIFEPNAGPGLTNRILGALVDRVYLGNAKAHPRFAPRRALVTGIPLRRDLAHRQPRRAGLAHVLITGGTQGSPFLNREAPALLAAVRQQVAGLAVWHQAGGGDLAAITESYRRMGLEARVDAFIDDMRDAYGWADVAVSAGGAVSLAELAAAQLPTLVVPRASVAEDHQTANARDFAAGGRGRCASEGEWQRADEAEWLTAQLLAVAAAPRLAGPSATAADAAEQIVRDCEQMLIAPRSSPIAPARPPTMRDPR